MMTAEEVRSVTFERAMRGYRCEDVDAFLDRVSANIEQLGAEKEDLEKKLYILAQKVDEYRKEEDALKSALINAQRLGDNVVHEAKAKADDMVREASNRAQRIIEASSAHEREEKDRLRRLEAEIFSFKSSILGLYQHHIETLSNIDRKAKEVHAAVFGDEPLPQPGAEGQGEAAGGSPDEAGAGQPPKDGQREE